MNRRDLNGLILYINHITFFFIILYIIALITFQLTLIRHFVSNIKVLIPHYIFTLSLNQKQGGKWSSIYLFTYWSHLLFTCLGFGSLIRRIIKYINFAYDYSSQYSFAKAFKKHWIHLSSCFNRIDYIIMYQQFQNQKFKNESSSYLRG